MKYLRYFEAKDDINFNQVLRGYLERILNQDDESGEMQEMTINDFSDSALELIKSDIQWFLKTALEHYDNPFESYNSLWIGERIYLSRYGYLGFDDGLKNKEVADFLDFLAESLGEVEYYIKDNEIRSYKFQKERPNLEEYKLKKNIKKFNV